LRFGCLGRQEIRYSRLWISWDELRLILRLVAIWVALRASVRSAGAVDICKELGSVGFLLEMSVDNARDRPDPVKQLSSDLRLRYRSAGEHTAPIIVRTPCGGGIFGGQTHSQSPEAIFAHVCGLKTVIPSNPYDAKRLLISAIEDDDRLSFSSPSVSTMARSTGTTINR
jgi:Transketolase, pyrimidine binding domain